MTRENVKVKPGHEYDRYFPPAKGGRILIKQGNAKVPDTLKLIQRIVRDTSWQMRKFADEVIKRDTLEGTANALFRFVYDHIAYKKDVFGKEQVRDFMRIWHDRHNVDPKTGEPSGCDCDCMTTFCCTALRALNIKNVYLRITRYEEDHWEHIYPVIKLPGGKEIIIDCVMHEFNKEAKYTEKQDTPMDLEYLNGIPAERISKLADAPDLMGLMDEKEAFSELGKIFKKKSSGGGGSAPAKKSLFKKKSAPSGGGAPAKKSFFKKKASPSGGNAPAKKKGLFKKPLIKKKTAEQKKQRKEKVKKFLGKGLHVTNRVNPATLALRGGVLAAMKINFLKIAGDLRWTYLSEEAAQEKGAIMDKWRKLKGVREKMEKIFYGAGGKPENLKKAILTGKGNKDKAVPMNGLGFIPTESIDGLHEDMPLNQLLGREIYHSEYVDGLDGIEELEGFRDEGNLGVATAASVAAASTVLTAIAGLIKSIGSVFPGKGKAEKTEAKKGKKGAKGGDASGESESGEDSAEEENSGSEAGGDSEREAGEGSQEYNTASSGEDGASGEEASSTGDDSSGGNEGDGETNGSNNALTTKDQSDVDGAGGGILKAATIEKAKTFWKNNSKMIIGSGIALTGLIGLIYLAKRTLRSKDAKPVLGLEGIRKKTKHKRKSGKNLLAGIKPKKGGTPTKRHQPKKKIALL